MALATNDLDPAKLTLKLQSGEAVLQMKAGQARNLIRTGRVIDLVKALGANRSILGDARRVTDSKPK